MLENRIEAQFGDKLEQFSHEVLGPKGYSAAYLKIQGAKGWPDRLLVWGQADGPANYIWIEWKRPGEQPRPLQKHIHKILRAMGADVRVYDDWRVALEEITGEVRAAIGAGPWDEAHLLRRNPPIPPAR